MIRKWFWPGLCLLLVFGSHTLSWAAEPIPPDQFAKLHKLIQPKPEEQKWLQIPWQTDLWKARKQAASEGKPILLWEMDGHPLGCT